MPSDSLVPLHFRIDRETREKFRTLAAENGCSETALLIAIIESSVARADSQPALAVEEWEPSDAQESWCRLVRRARSIDAERRSRS